MREIEAICIWQDTQGDISEETGERMWIVSRDTLDADGQAVCTETLHVVDTEDEAIEQGSVLARQQGLPLYANPENGPASQLS